MKRRIVAAILLLAAPLAIACVLMGISRPEPVGAPGEVPFAGSGTQSDPYRIQSAEDLFALRDLVNAGDLVSYRHFVQTADISLEAATNEAFEPIGAYGKGHYFSGTYDGLGHVISGIQCNGGCAGLFGNLEGTVKNLGVVDGVIAGSHAGAIASQASKKSFIYNCFNATSVCGQASAGGIVDCGRGEVRYCWNLGDVQGPEGSVGGIAAYDAGTYVSCHSVGQAPFPEKSGLAQKSSNKELSAADKAALEVAIQGANALYLNDAASRGEMAYPLARQEDGYRLVSVGQDEVTSTQWGRDLLLSHGSLLVLLVGALASVVAWMRLRAAQGKRREDDEVTSRHLGGLATKGGRDDEGDGPGEVAVPSAWRRLVPVVVFVALFGFGLFRAGSVLELKTGSGGVTTMRSYHVQPKGAVDVLVVGSSRAGKNLDADELWTKYGISSYFLWGSEQTFWNSYYFLREALQANSPKVVVLEMRAATYAFEYQDESWQYANTDGLRQGPQKWEAIRAAAPQGRWADLALGMPVYHTRFNELTQADFASGASVYYKGSDVRYGAGTLDALPDASAVNEVRPLDQKEEAYLERIVALVQGRGIPLVFLSTPAPDADLVQPYYNRVSQIADQHGVTYLNLGLHADQAGIGGEDFWLSDFHLNTYGARKASDYLAEKLEAAYHLEDHRGEDAYASWDVASHDLQNAFIGQIDDRRQLLQELRRDNRALVLAAHGQGSQDLLDGLVKDGEEAGLDLSFLSDAERDRLYVLQSTREPKGFVPAEENVCELGSHRLEVAEEVDSGGSLTILSDGNALLDVDGSAVVCVVVDTYTNEVVKAVTL